MNSLLTLPDEIKLKIFQYLDGIDKIQLIKVCHDLQRIGTDRNVLQYLNFQLAYKLSLAELRFIGGKSNAICVTILNLNGIHWIPPAAFRDTLTRFKNLNALYVLDTQLALRDLVTVMDKAQKIKKLALSLKPDNCADVFKVRIPLPLTHLYVTYNSYSIRSLITLITQFETLEELWMIEPKKPVIYNIPDEMSWSNYVNSPLPCVSKRIVCTRQHPSIGGEQFFFSSLKDTTKKWSQVHFRMCTSLIYVFETADCENSAVYRFFGASFLIDNEEVNVGLTVGDTEADRSYVHRWIKPEPEASASTTVKPKENLTSTEFRMIYFSGDIKNLLLLLLFSKEASAIRKFQSCGRLFYKTDSSPGEEKVVELFKKRRLSPVSAEIDHDSPFKKFTLSTPNMEDFEINDMDTTGVRKRLWTTDNLIFITNWKMLKKLTITSTNIMNGKFLIEITKNCPLLSCLKIKDEQMQDRIGSHLCEALKYASNLKDFRYETKGVASIDPLLLALAKCAKLERLFIYCRHTVKISKNPLESVITRCENLIFLFIFIRELPDSTCKSIKQRLNEFGLKHKQIITVRGQNYTLQNIMYEDIPAVHTEDIISQDNELKICAEYLRTFFYC